MKILGISAYFHSSAAAICVDGNIVAAVEEERFSRIKHDAKFPVESIQFCLDKAQITLSELDAVVFYEKPFLKLERILESFYESAPLGLTSFITAMPHWFGEKVFTKSNIQKALKKIDADWNKKTPLLFPEHHLSHAASAYFSSGFEQAAILTIDGVGEWATATICKGERNQIKLLKELQFPHSIGFLYSAFTYFLGFKVNSGEYKLMGMAAYGTNGDRTQTYIRLIKEHLVNIAEDGSIQLTLSYFGFLSSLKMIKERKWEKLFGFSRRKPDESITLYHVDLALAIQKVIEEIVLKLALTAKELTQTSRLCMAGGVALNSVANGKLVKANVFDEVFIQPAAGDAGGALGAALAANHIYFNAPILVGKDRMQGSLLGSDILEKDIRQLIDTYQLPYHVYSEEKVADLLAEGQVVGRCVGPMEFGPRALGNRSILADPRFPDMQKRINLKVKKRESFRPFAPVILAEFAAQYFEMEADRKSPYMLLVHPIRAEYRRPIPTEFSQWSIEEKLNFPKSDYPGITHADFSSRIQTVDQEDNPSFRRLLEAFHQKTDCPMLINTSFNQRGEPLVRGVEDAWACFMRTDIDVLILNQYLFFKKDLINLDKSQFDYQFAED